MIEPDRNIEQSSICYKCSLQKNFDRQDAIELKRTQLFAKDQNVQSHHTYEEKKKTRNPKMMSFS